MLQFDNRRFSIEILNENGLIINSISINSSTPRNFCIFKKLISYYINAENKKVEYFCTDELGRLKSIKNSQDFSRNMGTNLYKVKISPLNSLNDNKEEISLNLFDNNQNFNSEVINDIKDSLKCWICLKDSIIEKPFFCPNPNCSKGVHEECLKLHGNNIPIRCACGKFYFVDNFKSNKLVNDFSNFAINVEKIRKDESNKIKDLENKIKDYESIPKKCEKHINDFLVHFCCDCDKAFCGTCLITNELDKHKNHRLINYEKYNEINNVIKDIESQTDIINKELNDFKSNIDTLEKNRDNYLKELQKIINDVKNKFEKFIKESKEKKEALINKNNNLLNLKEKAKNFFNSLDKTKYNELQNYEIKNELNFNKKNGNNVDNILEEIKTNLNDIKIVNININKNLEKLLENKHTFDPLIFVDKLGRRYIGERKNNLKEGKGIYYFKNGNKYEGEFKNDKMDGEGILYYANGERFEGKFKEDLKNGKGTHFFKNGTSVEQTYLNGVFIGNDSDVDPLFDDF